MNTANNLKPQAKLIGGFLIVALIIPMVAFIAWYDMRTLNDVLTTMYFEQLVSIAGLDKTSMSVREADSRLHLYILLPEEREKNEQAIGVAVKTVDENLAMYRRTLWIAEDVTILTQFDAQWSVFKQAVNATIQQIKVGDEQKAYETIATDGIEGKALQGCIDSLQSLMELKLNMQFAEEINRQGDMTITFSTWTLIIVSITGMSLVLVLGLIINRTLVVRTTDRPTSSDAREIWKRLVDDLGDKDIEKLLAVVRVMHDQALGEK